VRGRTQDTFRAGLVGIVVVAAITYFGFTKRNPLAHPFEVKVAFTTAHDLKPRSPVRIAGIEVGKVRKVEVVGDGRSAAAIVTMEIRDRGLPLHEDATFKVRPRLFLEGNYFVDVSPGSPSAPALDSGDTVPATQSAAPVGVGEVLTALQTDTREDLRRVLQEYGKALDGSGARGYNRSIPYWEPAYRDGAKVAEATLGLFEHDLSEYVDSAGVVAAGIDRDPQRLKDLITDLAITAGAFASEQRNLQATIHELPDTLRVGSRALAALNGAFPSVRRLARELTPAVRTSPPALAAQQPFFRELRGLISEPEVGGLARDLRAAVPTLVRLNEGGAGLQEQQRAFASCQANVIAPWQEDEIVDPAFKSSGRVYEEGVKWTPGIAAESRNTDANGQYVRSFAQNANFAYALGGNRFFFTQLPVQGVNPPRTAMPPLAPGVPCETQQPPDLRTIPGAPPAAIRVDQDAPGAAARRAESRATLMAWMRDQMKISGLDEVYELVDTPLRADQIDDVKRTLERGR
jgi:phospholipid/cholesterol/gamma-HCH transport system substrate-binding protein